VSDAALILRARGGDELAFRRLLDRYRGLIHKAASLNFLPRGSSADLHQEALIGFHEAVSGYSPERGNKFKGFAWTCMRREVLTAVGAATRKKHGPLNESTSPDAPVGDNAADALTLGETGVFADPRASADPHATIEVQGDLRRLATAVNSTLTEREREAVMGIAEGDTYRDIAERLGCDVKSIDNASQRAQVKLSEAMAA
jgi:RNA polymerase sporulation-specific sigma factor